MDKNYPKLKKIENEQQYYKHNFWLLRMQWHACDDFSQQADYVTTNDTGLTLEFEST